jgi:hypothetical protein
MADSTLFDRWVSRLETAGVVRAAELQGCSDIEIREIEKQVSAPLPPLYREFMRRMGVKAGHFHEGTDWQYPIVLRNRELAEDLLKEDTDPPYELKPSHFAFASNQGYTFLFFDALAGSDPPVYLYVQGEAAPQLVEPSFSAWLERVVSEET